MPPPLLHSPPLELQPAGPRDLDFFADLNSNADVMDRGLGYWVDYVDTQPIGWTGLGSNEAQPDAGELGFRVQHEHGRRGLGKEGAGTLVHYAFSDFALDLLWPGTVTANTASGRTLAAVGMEHTEQPFPGALTYEITDSSGPGQGAEGPDPSVRDAADHALIVRSSHGDRLTKQAHSYGEIEISPDAIGGQDLSGRAADS